MESEYINCVCIIMLMYDIIETKGYSLLFTTIPTITPSYCFFTNKR